MADQLINELGGDPGEAVIALVIGLELAQRIFQTVRDLDFFTPDCAHELDVMIAGNTESFAGFYHFLYQPDDLRNLRAAIHEIAHKDGPSSFRMVVNAIRIFCIGQLLEQLYKLVIAAVNIADDVERPVLMFQVVPERLARDLNSVNFFRRGEVKHMAETFTLQAAKRATEILCLITNHMRAKV